jgi:hypothetical protein
LVENLVLLKNIDPISLAKVGALLGVLEGLIAAVVLFLFAAPLTAFVGALPRSFSAITGLFLLAIPVLGLVGGFITGWIEAWLYNFLAKRLGGIKFQFKGNEIQNVDLWAISKLAAIFGVILGFVTGIIITVISLFGIGLLGFIGIIFIIVFPIVFAIALFVESAIFTAIYNFIAGRTSGIKIYLNGKTVTRIDPLSYAKIVGIIELIPGLIIGISYLISAASPVHSASTPSLVYSLGALTIVVFPLIYFVLGFVGGLLLSVIYNLIASSRVGGVKITLTQ